MKICTFRFTSPKNFKDAKTECQSYGGDIIYKNLGPAGVTNHEYNFTRLLFSNFSLIIRNENKKYLL